MNVQSQPAISSECAALSEYISAAADRELPPEVITKSKHHILDTLAAILSGSRLRAGELAARYVERLGGAAEATVIGTSLMVPAEWAAMANGMAGHADETDDSHLGGRFHPGCGIIPAALAVAEQQDRSGAEFIRAVTLGYDIGARLNMSLGYANPSAAQQASGCPYWHRDSEHVEKAFDFGGMGARNGVAAVMMVAAGMTGVDDAFSGVGNFFFAFAHKAQPALLAESLGKRFEIMGASIKKWCVGSPIQAVLDAATALIAEHKIGADDARRIFITMPHDRMHIVDNRDIVDICVQHLTALALLDGTLGFAAAHDEERMHDPAVRAVRSRIELIPSPELTVAVPARQATVEIELADGRKVRHHAKAVRGTPDNPMTTKEIEEKAVDLVSSITGRERANGLVEAIRRLDKTTSVRELQPLLQA
jgi:2-methylcitrate dehydratase PrpD